ncbi:hypothetical protein [uncultured Bacteroides sp.]|uniref:hypothetical protein n=1 Tax=uncultured Bacteroides sp. TaxID=162156 RepID=UPI002AAACE78|nr:hypothetical protein [uncultured Bacteroides sp.]
MEKEKFEEVTKKLVTEMLSNNLRGLAITYDNGDANKAMLYMNANPKDLIIKMVSAMCAQKNFRELILDVVDGYNLSKEGPTNPNLN